MRETSPINRTREDAANIVLLEHVNVTQPDQRLATLFYVCGLGFTRDPFLFVGVENMWVNIGRNQMHLPTDKPQRVRGIIGLVAPDLDALERRLDQVAPELAGTCFSLRHNDSFVEVTCPWGNRFRCHAPGPEFGPRELGIAYVDFAVAVGTASRIAEFYKRAMGAPSTTVTRNGAVSAAISTGQDQHLFFTETSNGIEEYDGHHIAIYIADFSGPYWRLQERNLITRDTDPHEWRFQDIVDLQTNEVLFTLEHEVRSLKHPLYGRPLINRNPEQTNQNYNRGKEPFSGSF
jgi:hypothetical protein